MVSYTQKPLTFIMQNKFREHEHILNEIVNNYFHQMVYKTDISDLESHFLIKL